MTDTSLTTSTELDRPHLQRRLPVLALAVLLLTFGFTAWGANTRGELWSMTALQVATIIGVYGFLLPRMLRRPSAGGTALVLSAIAAAAVVPAFWSGLPMILGVAGALLGSVGRTADRGGRLSIAAFVLGLLSVLAYVAIYVADAMAQTGMG